MKDYTCRPVSLRRIPVFDASAILGAPFKVFLTDAVDEKYDIETGEPVGVVIPKHNELMAVVAMLRACNERKLSGEDVRFLRKSRHMKAKEFAEENCVAPETLSRIENGKQAISPLIEKLVRLNTCLALLKFGNVAMYDQVTKLTKMEMKAVSSDLEPLCFELKWEIVAARHTDDDTHVYSALSA